MILFLLSLLAGILTVLAPCTISLLPVIVGGSLSGETSLKRALVVTISLGISVIAFTILLKVSTTLVNVPQTFWEEVSGIIIIVLGVTMIFPKLWDSIPFLNTINKDSNRILATGYNKQNVVGDILVGAALGPVFSSCSPTYFLILATVLPRSLAEGFIYLLAYAVGLCGMLLLVTIIGQRIMGSLGVASDPRGWFKRAIGVVFLAVGIAIFFGYDKTVELAVASHIYDVTQLEQTLLPRFIPSQPTTASGTVQTDYLTDTSTATSSPTNMLSTAARIAAKSLHYNRAPEITNPSGYINTNGQPITINEFKGKKVVLVDIWTYSCINCQRTIPYLKEWYAKYHDQGLEIIGIHTPEFAFEKVQSNVEQAVKSFGILWPVVLDNEYGTWNAFGNQFWPRKYLIDSDGFIVYDHAGEGNYDVTEKAIQKALAERAQILGQTAPIPSGTVATPPPVSIEAGSPETYFGASRNEFFGNGIPGTSGKNTFTIQDSIADNTLYLGGTWNILDEYAESIANSSVAYKYTAKGVYLVAGANNPITVEVQLDGSPMPSNMKGADIIYKNGKSYVTVQTNRLYKLIDASSASSHTLKLIIPQAGLQAFTFTFG
ncbi:MAG: hypothetical protein JWO50_621 [Candidatus Kaiserbacteria bacterium]|nr:hypothetical protein [Candidatus Kaiserbacteria bacterium]